MADDAIEKGQSYLLARIRSRELASRAPEDSPYKDWDGTGEAYLALDAVIAAGERMTGDDRRGLVERLMRKQRQGAWDYRGGEGPDVDTTSSAIRALDRLGHSVVLDGLKRFYNPQTQLFNTFGRAADRLDLQFPPQSREKHLGAHPCVMPNVWLLLRERGLLKALPAKALERMQRPDGGWHTYFYPSPHYATRLMAELLSAMGDAHVQELQRTLDSLLAAAPPASATQAAEVSIALACLRGRFAIWERTIGEKARDVLAGLRAAQLGDGSWPGEVIWTFLHRTGPGPVIALDHLRVRSTSLCVRALRLWH
jgi:hypothetical protein